MSRQSKYSSGRGFNNPALQNMTLGQLQAQMDQGSQGVFRTWAKMLPKNKGTRAAALFGSTVDSDWKQYHPLEIPGPPGKDPKKKKQQHGPAPEMPRVRGTRQPGSPDAPMEPGAAAGDQRFGGLAVPTNGHWLGNVRGMYGPAGELSNDAPSAPVWAGGGWPGRSALPVGRGALPPGSQFAAFPASGAQPLMLGGGGWNKDNAIEASEAMPALGPGESKARRRAGGNPAAFARIGNDLSTIKL